jgi:large subunit ribosomal protein L15
MATRLRHVRHQRGSRTHGWGTSGQHRGSGMRGGSGITGRYRHKRSRLIRTGEFSNLHYAGKKGFNPLSKMKPRGRTLNLWQLSDLTDKLAAEKKPPAGEKLVVDLKELGFEKLLGTGSISRPVQVKVDQCSEGALKKIKEAGGEAVVATKATTPPKK